MNLLESASLFGLPSDIFTSIIESLEVDEVTSTIVAGTLVDVDSLENFDLI